MRPDADPGEEVALRESSQVVRCDIFNTPFINFARGDMTAGDQVTQPLSCKWVDFVVVGCLDHAASLAVLAAFIFSERSFACRRARSLLHFTHSPLRV